MTQLQKAVLKTLAYADIFDYPLTLQEIERWLIKFKAPSSKIKTTIQNAKLIQAKKGFYFLNGKEELLELREKREKWSQNKLKIAQKVAKWLKLVPTISMVAVTGALAMNNADEEDDIDLLIVTRRDRLWLTRLFTVFLVELVARRRRPGDKKVKDKICLNMFLTEDCLRIPPKEQNLFSAHEVYQLKPIWDRNEVYQKFLAANRWSKNFLPNVMDIKRLRGSQAEKRTTKLTELTNSQKFQCLSLLEKIVYQLQLRYMRPRKTIEIVEPCRIRFHPQDHQKRIMLEYKKRLESLKIG